ncbi:MAG: hypothetical protein GY705_20635 [Bacteroidetes bacterium]|nr:hypothetical protein [Bacteroidota bacterium]
MPYKQDTNKYYQSSGKVTITVLSGLRYTVIPNREQNTISPSQHCNNIDTFITQAKQDNTETNFDFFANKVNLAEDKINLLREDIQNRHYLIHSNLANLYQELLIIDQWRLQRPYPEIYSRDATWLKLNQMEFKVREQIRGEMKEGFKDLTFHQNDLREAALDFKKQQQKSNMLDIGDLESIMENS